MVEVAGYAQAVLGHEVKDAAPTARAHGSVVTHAPARTEPALCSALPCCPPCRLRGPVAKFLERFCGLSIPSCLPLWI